MAEMLKQSQSRVMINPGRNKEQNRSFRKQRFEKVELKGGEM